jgi:hypothetical protein
MDFVSEYQIVSTLVAIGFLVVLLTIVSVVRFVIVRNRRRD